MEVEMEAVPHRGEVGGRGAGEAEREIRPMRLHLVLAQVSFVI